MQIKLYQTDDAANVINKTLTGEKSITVNLRRDFDLYSPELTLRMTDANEALSFNYVKIPNLLRSYFIDNVENVGANRWRYALSVDVLETYKADILSGTHLYRRSIEGGDYGNVSLADTGREIIDIIEGDTTLEPSENSIVSLSTWSY